MKTVNLSGLPTGEQYLWKIGTEENPISGGVNLADLEYMLGDNQSPKMKNMWYDGRVLGKRPGQRVAADVLPGEVFAIVRFGDALIAAADTRLVRVTWEESAEARSSATSSVAFGASFPSRGSQGGDGGATARVTELYTGLTAQKGNFFTFGDRLYYLNGAEYIVYDGRTAEAVAAYEPNIIINRPPNGEGGDLTDNYNRLGGGFRNTFSADGTSKVYHLTDKGLDETAVTATVNGEELASGFTVDRAAGTVTFAAAPAKGTNNVVIRASRFDEEAREMRRNLLACTVAAAYGGENESRVFLAGNGTATYFYSDVTRPDYFPENNYNTVGEGGRITALAGQYGVLIVFKEDEIWQIGYSFDGERARFPLKAVNRTVGCDAPGSVQLINNSLVWLHSKRGVFLLLSTAVEDERNVQKISRNIESSAASAEGERSVTGRSAPPRSSRTGGKDPSVAALPQDDTRAPAQDDTRRGAQDDTEGAAGEIGGLFAGGDLKNAASADWRGKYWLAVGDGACWVWDYEASPYMQSANPDLSAKALAWFYLDGVRARHFLDLSGLPVGEGIGFGHEVNGFIVTFFEGYTDFGRGYEAFWRMPIRSFNLMNRLKTVLEMWVTVRTDTNTKIEIRYITEKTRSGEADPEPIVASSFSWRSFAWDTFSWAVRAFAKTYRRKPKKKKIEYFAIEFRCDEPRRDMNISGVALSWRAAKKVK